jgi:predicted SAM-dependent methyltransferase
VDYCDSLSCLHALEHFGLGRYGDKIDYQGHKRGWNNLYKILKKGGKLYFSVPIGTQRIEFNAHRVFSMDYLLKMIEGRYKIDSFSYVNDAGDLVKNAELNDDLVKTNFSCHYGCGIFELTKL